MYLIDPKAHSRRAFLKRTAALAGTGAALPMALNLAALGEAAAFNATDYKALVCVFLYGGNDYANTVVTYDEASHAKYAALRGDISIARSALTPTLLNPTAALPGGRQYALHPSMGGVAHLFNTGKAAVLLNAGPLVVPMSRVEYEAQSRPVPPKLFSHNDQQSIWQSQRPEGSTVGWGGNLGDLALGSNGSGSLFTCVSVTGNSVFLAGDTALSYQVSTRGAVQIDPIKQTWTYGSNKLKDAMLALTQQARTNVLENEYNVVTKRAIGAEVTITSALEQSKPTGNAYPLPFNEFGATGNNLSDQMRMVARLIAARQTLGVKRQVFMVSMGGFDLHDNLISRQPTLLGRVNDAMVAFQNTMQGLGISDKVTAFTASDFGRTLTSNGDGSDHGWGGHQIMIGGAVKGRQFYGTAPPLSNTATGSPEDIWHVGQGRLLPTSSVDQMAATLATWFGVEASELDGILPNLRNFGGNATFGGQTFAYPKNMGFML